MSSLCKSSKDNFSFILSTKRQCNGPYWVWEKHSELLTLDIFKKFISTVTGIQGIVGHGLESCTNKIAVFKISFPELPGFAIHFVDTPGFDDTTKSDVDIFKMISDCTCVVTH